MSPLTRTVVFRVHWLLGISAGLILAIVGFTGAMIGLQQPLTDVMNPQLHLHPVGGPRPKSPDTLIHLAQVARRDARPRNYQWEGTDRPVSIRMTRGRQKHGELLSVDPYSGKIMPPPLGADFFRACEKWHRNLAAGEIGKQLVGASTTILLILITSGMILRWPRRAHTFSIWLKPALKYRGRNLLKNLHSVIGTWLLGLYLLASLTGLWWSYDFYREALNHLAGVSGPLRPRGSPESNPGAPLVTINTAWQAFRLAVPGATRASVELSHDPQKALRIRYQTPTSSHERAWDTMAVDATGVIVEQQSYVEQSRGRRFILSLFPLHSGSFFGTPGRWVMVIASLLMPLFTVSGIFLWLLRRRSAHQRARLRNADYSHLPLSGDPNIPDHAE